MPWYLLSVVLYFWVPVAILAWRLFPSTDGPTRRAFRWTIAIYYPLAMLMEYVYLYFDIWTFSEAKDPLLGPRLFGAPIEEFVFWFGAPPFVMLIYLGFERLFRRLLPRGEERVGRQTVPEKTVLDNDAGAPVL